MGIKSNLSAGSIIPALATLAIALMTGSAGNLAAQTNKPAGATNAAPVEKGNRFLLIVDTSASMKPSAGDVVRAVDEILLSGASSQLRPGDTLGVWTFNEQLHPGVMPLQTWRPEDKELVARRTREFLKKQHYGKQSQLAAALQGMYAVVNSSDIITVVLISNGQSPMQGTPFDQKINAAYVQAAKDMKGSHKPIVTVLQARRGKFFRYSVNALPWPVVIPEVPIALRETDDDSANTQASAATPETPPAAPASVPQPAPAPAPTAPSLIVRGNPAPVALPPATPPASPAQVPSLNVTGAPAAPPPSTTAIPTPVGPPTGQQIVATSQVRPPKAFPTRAPGSLPPPAMQPRPQPMEVADNTPDAPPAVPKPEPHAGPAINHFINPSRKGPPPNPAGNPMVASTIHHPAERPEPLGFKPSQPPPEESDTKTNAAAMHSAAPPSLLAATDSRSKLLLAGSVAAGAVGLGLIAVLISRSRNPPGPSLISRSMGNISK